MAGFSHKLIIVPDRHYVGSGRFLIIVSHTATKCLMEQYHNF